jgi:nucleotide-binding universal stress UspA family protein/nitrite reductase/ring-hydroxylating ferredoxin subunit
VAEDRAARLAKRLGAEFSLIHVSAERGATDDEGDRVLREAAERARVLGIDAANERRQGEIAPEIMAAAAELGADLLVVGDHGMGPSNRFSLGGIPNQVAHHSPIDILVVRTSDPEVLKRPYRKILIATDGSLTAHQAARHGYALAQGLEADVALIYVGDALIGDIVLRDTATRLGDEETERIVATGNPAAQISRFARHYDLLVVGNKGMTGSRRYIRRAVPHDVAHGAPSDVLIVKTVGRSFFDLRPGEGAVVEYKGEKVAAYIDPEGTTYTLSARCQHMGCTVGWNGRALTWDCPCHGSRYDFTGAIINGPTTKPLPPVGV